MRGNNEYQPGGASGGYQPGNRGGRFQPGGTEGGFQPGGFQPGGMGGRFQPGGAGGGNRADRGNGNFPPVNLPAAGVNAGNPNPAETKKTEEPLVPAFGETELPQTPVLAFGQKTPQTAVKAAKTAPAADANQTLRSAQEMMTKFDKNKNGTLDKDKGEWNNLPFRGDTFDRNRDGRLSMSELMTALGGTKNSGTVGNAVVSTKQTTPYDHLPAGVPDWFFDMDINQDAQITMQEYVNGSGGVWTEEIAKEFKFLDKNNDGNATVAEVFAVLKQVDEQRALEAEKARREFERRRGIASLPPPPEMPESEGSPDSDLPLPETPPTGTMPAVSGVSAVTAVPATGPAVTAGSVMTVPPAAGTIDVSTGNIPKPAFERAAVPAPATPPAVEIPGSAPYSAGNLRGANSPANTPRTSNGNSDRNASRNNASNRDPNSRRSYSRREN
ncbi:MAG: hypothetical protein LBH00_11990 [Planctomycetaceae bacterium]|nr:hypothetical protein [Planctomycetaceae bacterium]